MPPTLNLVVPCYNEEKVLRLFADEVVPLFKSLIMKNEIAATSRILFVDDGSTDETWQVIREIAESESLITGIRLASNLGHQLAVTIGYSESLEKSHLVGSIDADLQDDPAILPRMLERIAMGSEVSVGVRVSRQKDSFGKRISAAFFYRLHGSELIPDHADYRIMTVAACRRLLHLAGSEPFLRGYMLRISQHIARVPYVREARAEGSTKYPIKKMIQLAQTSFVGNLKRIADLGFRIALGSLAVIVILLGYLVVGWVKGGTSPGWLSLSAMIVLFNSLIITLLGSILLRLRDTSQRKIIWSDWIIDRIGMD